MELMQLEQEKKQLACLLDCNSKTSAFGLALTEADAIVFHVARPMQEEEAAPAAAEATEPEAIKEKKKEDAE